jgi:hypothetical protein
MMPQLTADEVRQARTALGPTRGDGAVVGKRQATLQRPGRGAYSPSACLSSFACIRATAPISRDRLGTSDQLLPEWPSR